MGGASARPDIGAGQRWWDGTRWRDGGTAPGDAPRAWLDGAGRPVMVLPGAVRVVRLAAALQGALGVLLGAATLLQWHAHGGESDGGDALLVVGAVQVLFSVAVIGAGAMLGRLSDAARVTLTCLEALNAAAVFGQALGPASLLNLVLDGLAMGALWLPAVGAAMAAARTPVPAPGGAALPRLLESPPRRASRMVGAAG